MGGMFTVVKVRDGQAPGDYRDPGWYRYPEGSVAHRVSRDPQFGQPHRRKPYGPAVPQPSGIGDGAADPTMPAGHAHGK
jgi:hypothetical protein